jgi:hypothetical protein
MHSGPSYTHNKYRLWWANMESTSLKYALRTRIIDWLIGDWKKVTEIDSEGYTLLLPVPADLPVFVKLAIENVSRQSHNHLNELLIIPDNYTDNFEKLVRKATAAHSLPPWRIIKFSLKDKLFAMSSNFVHFQQIVSGLAQVRTSYTLIHDADLFLLDKNFFEDHFAQCANNSHLTFGLDWRKSIGPEKKNVAATWEIMVNTEWARSFNRFLHRKRAVIFNGDKYGFDTLLLAQYLSPSSKIGISSNQNYCHLNFAIASYRRFRNSIGPFNDWQYKLLLLRLCICEYDDSSYNYGLPTDNEFIAALDGNSRKVTYSTVEAHEYYTKFKKRVDDLRQKKILTDKGILPMLDVINRFDEKLL